MRNVLQSNSSNSNFRMSINLANSKQNSRCTCGGINRNRFNTILQADKSTYRQQLSLNAFSIRLAESSLSRHRDLENITDGCCL